MGTDKILQTESDVTLMKKTLRYRFKRMNWGLLALAVPGLIFLVAFYYAPLFGLIIPFKNMDYAKGIFGSDWAGFKNFEFFFKSQDSWRITWNTLRMNGMFIAITICSAVILALLLFELGRRQVKVYQTAMFVPYFISWVVASYILYALISPSMGVIPNLCAKIGVEVPNFYSDPQYWNVIMVIAYLWKNIGYMTLLFYAALMGIDTTQFEAAAIDGATKLQIAWRISIPFLSSIITLMTLLQIGKIFYADFGMFYFLTKNSGMLYSVTDVIDTYVFRALRVTGDIGMASAAGLYQSCVGFALVLVSNLVVRRFSKENALF